MGGKGLTIVKLGGSLITDKNSPMTLDASGLVSAASALANLGGDLIVIHGGGSFGHHVASKYGLSSQPSKKLQIVGVFKTRDAMQQLNIEVLTRLEQQGIHTYSFPPIALMDGRKPSTGNIALLKQIVKAGLTPVTYGDVLPSPRGFYILSGDGIVQMITRELRPRRIVFALDVDGIYPNPKAISPNSRPIPVINARNAPQIGTSKVTSDVTGGILAKLRVGLTIAKEGTDVIFASGRKPEVLLKALKGDVEQGTIIPALNG
ncbi:MAG: gamma-glutamyl kinase [Thaumarchaeota archaeon]|nr:gamma-glutamyl kinase [Nitrososphaerota archaeon]|tara:strand:- start:2644 stop:3429 length:786 start_codon:yes stop_codon:yes gene_type:complete